MSPKSRGRPKGRGRQAARRPARGAAPVVPLRRSVAAELLADAPHLLTEPSALQVELWASAWLGQAWASSGLGQRDPDGDLCLDVARKAVARPTASALAAVAALARVAPPSGRDALDDAVRHLTGTATAPSWLDAPPHRPARAWRAVDVWDSERVLFVDLDDPVPHTLLVAVRHVGGTLVDAIGVLEPGAAGAWDSHRDADEPPMPVAEAPLDDVLRELAGVLELNDITWPRSQDESVVENRAIAWSACRDHLTRTDRPELDDAEREALLAAFRERPDVAALAAEPESVGYVSSLCLDYGTGYMPTGHLCWSPSRVAHFLVDWLPRKAHLDADDRAALPGVLRSWVRFALERRGVPPEWITPVVDAVDTCMPGFDDDMDDPTSWGPAKQLVTRLQELGVDLSDQQAVDAAIREVNAENLARGLLDR